MEGEAKPAFDECVSVIVPVYGVERYLSACVESILRQTYDNLEILLVDDGSPDSCGEICDGFARRDSRVRVFHRPNGGVSAARNWAIDRAAGRYLTFVDSDDILSPHYIECLYRVLRMTDADISLCGNRNIPEQNWESAPSLWDGEDFSVSEESVTVYSTKEAMRALLYQVPIDAAPWSKLFKRELFEGIRFPLNCWYEDIAIMPQLFHRAKRLAYCPYEGYGYLLRGEGTTLKRFSDEKMQLVDIVEKNERMILGWYPDLKAPAYSRTVRANLHIYSQIPMEKQYRNYRRRIGENVRKRRMTILADKGARRGTKLALCLTCGGLWTIRALRQFKALAKK